MIGRSDNDFQDICTTFGVMTLTWAWAGKDRATFLPRHRHYRLENAQAMAAHESPRTTKLYDRTGDEITLDEVERISI